MRAIVTLVAIIPSTACIVGATYLASDGALGWGWLLLLALLMAPEITWGKE